MSNTYFLLLQWLPEPLAKVVLALWYFILMLAVVSHIFITPSGFMYWDA